MGRCQQGGSLEERKDLSSHLQTFVHVGSVTQFIQEYQGSLVTAVPDRLDGSQMFGKGTPSSAIEGMEHTVDTRAQGEYRMVGWTVHTNLM